MCMNMISLVKNQRTVQFSTCKRKRGANQNIQTLPNWISVNVVYNYVTTTFIASSEGTIFEEHNMYQLGLRILVLIMRLSANDTVFESIVVSYVHIYA